MNALQNKILAALRGKNKRPYSMRELAQKTNIKKTQKKAFSEAMAALVSENKVIESGGRFFSAEGAGLQEAEIVKVNATFGFARLLAEEGKDVFVPGRLLLGSMPGDIVLLKQKRSSGQLPEGEVVKVVQMADRKFSGVLRINEDECVILPDSYVKFPLKAHRRELAGASDGDKVIAEIKSRGKRHSEHMVRVLEGFGGADSAASCCKAVLAANDITTEFPDEALEQAQAIAGGQGIHPKELAARLDLRDETIFTIDGADSKDLDDAISLRKLDNGWELGVHIADVSYYVTHQSPLDLEAFHRGTSVYYADSVVPMLPQELSNGICSLNPGEDRLAFSALMKLDAEGRIQHYEFRKTVIRSRVKGVYTEVNAILDGTAGPDLGKKYDGLTDTIFLMRELAAILTRTRFARGGVDLDTVESKIIVGPDGKAAKVEARSRGESERMIEEFMLTANEAAALLAMDKQLPFVYRTHENPAPDKLSNLFEILERLGIPFKRPKGGISSGQLGEIVTKAKGTDVEKIIGTMVLRSMAKAKYTERNIGHFGLGLDNYAHFTSPIRRYPDLTIHRILSGYVTGMKMENLRKRFTPFVSTSASRSTEREIAAMTAERSCEDCYKAEYMLNFIGQEFDGAITGVTAFGVYVQLDNTVEGLLALRDFPAGDWVFDGSIAYTESQTGQRMRLGDTVRIKVAAAHVSMGQIDFLPAQGSGAGQPE